jgi:hypothetical protein
MDYFWKFSKKSIDEYDNDIDLMIDTLHKYCCNTWTTLVSIKLFCVVKFLEIH